MAQESEHLLGNRISDKSSNHLSETLQDIESSPRRKPKAKWPPQMNQFESLEYNIPENTLFWMQRKQESRHKKYQVQVMKWSICLAIGILTASLSFMVGLSTGNLAGFKYWFSVRINSRTFLGSFMTYATFNMSLALSACLLVLYIAPAAIGSGIPEVKAYLNGVDIPNFMTFQTLVVKVLGCILAVSSGLALGKEGPFIYIGAAVASVLTQGFDTLAPKNSFYIFNIFKNDRDRRDYITCGAAAGLAAAFRAPIGGVLFAMEELSTWWRNRLLWLMFFTTTIANIVIKLFNRICLLGKSQACGFYFTGSLVIYEVIQGQSDFALYELVPILVIGALGGTLGALFNWLVVFTTKKRQFIKKHFGKVGAIIEVLSISLLTSAIQFYVPTNFNCIPCPAYSNQNSTASLACPGEGQNEARNFVNYNCQARSPQDQKNAVRYYNDAATLFFNTQDDAIINLFSARTKDEFRTTTLLTYNVIFYMLVILTSGLTVPVGLLVPSIVIGAGYGRIVGKFMAKYGTHIEEGSYAILGSASFLGGTTRMTVSMCVMLLELTNNMQLLPPMMLVLLTAKIVGDLTGVGPLYDAQADMKGIPILNDILDRRLAKAGLRARDLVQQSPISFNVIESIRAIVETLRSTPHNSFPVMGHINPSDPQVAHLQSTEIAHRHFLGTVTRQQLLVLLTKQGLFFSGRASDNGWQSLNSGAAITQQQYNQQSQQQQQNQQTTGEDGDNNQISMEDFTKSYTQKQKSIDDVLQNLSLQDLSKYVDLRPLLNPNYSIVQENTSLMLVYRLFLGLGLRQLYVIKQPSQALGIITRKDLTSQQKSK